MNIFADQLAPVVYRNDAHASVAGLAIVRAHALLSWWWLIVVMAIGWVASLVGLQRMASPAVPQAADNVSTYLWLATTFAIRIMLSGKAGGPKKSSTREPAHV